MSEQIDNRKKMLKSAQQLLRRQGYHATTFMQIMKESAAPRGSMYFYFPQGKEEVSLQALQEVGEEMKQAITRFSEAYQHPADALEAYILWVAKTLEQSGFVDGCPVSTVALETVPQSAVFTQVCAEILNSWRDALYLKLLEIQVSPERANSLATLILASVEGALILSRVQLNITPLKLVATELADLVRNLLNPTQVS